LLKRLHTPTQARVKNLQTREEKTCATAEVPAMVSKTTA